MNWKEWSPLYTEIERDFGFPYEREVESRDALSSILGEDFLSVEEIGRVIGGEVYVAGYGPNLEREIERIPQGATVLAADDAAPILMDFGIEPRIIMTDLDGDVKELKKLETLTSAYTHMGIISLCSPLPESSGGDSGQLK